MIILACLCCAVLPGFAEEESAPAVVAEAAPRLQVDSEDVISTRSVMAGEREVVFQKLRSLSLPPIPEPEMREPMTEEELEAWRESIPEFYRTRKHLFVGASAYVVKDENGNEEYFSKVRYWPDYQGEAVEFWTNANFIWLSGQMADFEIGGQVFSLMLASSVVDVGAWEALAEQQGAEGSWVPNVPDFPEFDNAAGSSIQVIEGDPGDEALAPIRALLSYYDANKPALKASYEQRRVDSEVRRLAREADPPERKKLIIRHWRLDQPAEKAAIIR